MGLARDYPNALLVVIGVPPRDAAYVNSQGLPQSRVLIDTEAKSTLENALFSRQLLHPNKSDKWLIVTSALHMPRAIGTSRKAGFTVISWPIADLNSDNRDSSRETMQEVLGRFAYWLLRRMNALLPGLISRLPPRPALTERWDHNRRDTS